MLHIHYRGLGNLAKNGHSTVLCMIFAPQPMHMHARLFLYCKIMHVHSRFSFLWYRDRAKHCTELCSWVKLVCTHMMLLKTNSLKAAMYMWIPRITIEIKRR